MVSHNLTFHYFLSIVWFMAQFHCTKTNNGNPVLSNAIFVVHLAQLNTIYKKPEMHSPSEIFKELPSVYWNHYCHFTWLVNSDTGLLGNVLLPRYASWEQSTSPGAGCQRSYPLSPLSGPKVSVGSGTHSHSTTAAMALYGKSFLRFQVPNVQK